MTRTGSTASSNEVIRPLFIALRAEFYAAFFRGTKKDELRKYGARWNERTCVVGRPVVLSRGYGKNYRLTGRIVSFKRQHGTTFGSTYKASIERIYGTLNLDIACISIALDAVDPAVASSVDPTPRATSSSSAVSDLTPPASPPEPEQ